jgi:hypothetical protein
MGLQSQSSRARFVELGFRRAPRLRRAELLCATRKKLPHEQPDTGPQGRDVEGKDQPGDIVRAGECLFADAHECRIEQVQDCFYDEQPHDEAGYPGARMQKPEATSARQAPATSPQAISAATGSEMPKPKCWAEKICKAMWRNACTQSGTLRATVSDCRFIHGPTSWTATEMKST